MISVHAQWVKNGRAVGTEAWEPRSYSVDNHVLVIGLNAPVLF